MTVSPVVARGGHVARIADAMAPDPKAWEMLCVRRGPSQCVCGQDILWQFLLKHEDGAEITIGSTCVRETLPWLLKMDAVELASAITSAWREVLNEQTRERRRAHGEERLVPLIPQAFELDEWWRALLLALEPHLNPPYLERAKKLVLPDWWRGQMNRSLRAGFDGPPGQQAGIVLRRITTFRERAPLLRVAVRDYVAARGIQTELWFDQPEAREVQEDLRELIGEVDALRPVIADLFARYGNVVCAVLGQEAADDLAALHRNPIKATVDDLVNWFTTAANWAVIDQMLPLEAAMEELDALKDHALTTRGRLRGFDDRYRCVADAVILVELDKLLPGGEEQNLDVLRSWNKASEAFLARQDTDSLSHKIKEFENVSEGGRLLRQSLTDIMNTAMAHFALPEMEAAIRLLPLWDIPKRLSELRVWVRELERTARSLPTVQQAYETIQRVRDGRDLPRCPNEGCLHLRFVPHDHQGKTQFDARSNGTTFTAPYSDVGRVNDGFPVCCREGSLLYKEGGRRVVLAAIQRTLPARPEEETTLLIMAIEHARALVSRL